MKQYKDAYHWLAAGEANTLARDFLYNDKRIPGLPLDRATLLLEAIGECSPDMLVKGFTTSDFSDFYPLKREVTSLALSNIALEISDNMDDVYAAWVLQNERSA